MERAQKNTVAWSIRADNTILEMWILQEMFREMLHINAVEIFEPAAHEVPYRYHPIFIRYL